MNDSPIPRPQRPGGATPGRLLAAAGVLVAAMAAPARSQSNLVNVETSCFSLHLQQDPNMVREMVVRLQVLGDEYAERARASGVALRAKPHIYVLSKPEDYVKMGGRPGSGYNLMVTENRLIYNIPIGANFLWNPVQETAFQLFGNAAWGGRLPPWVYQGMATYYSLARWTGDGYVTGIVPNDLVRPAQLDQREGKAPGLDKMLPYNLIRWYQEAGALERSRKAWAMVQFLLHGDGGKYRTAFTGYLQDCAKGDSAVTAFGKYFGTDTKAFESRYQQWLTSPQAEPNTAMQTLATVSTLTSFLARGHFLKMKFPTAEDFFQAAKAGKVLVDGAKAPALWLPAHLLGQNLKDVEKLGVWALDSKKALPTLLLTEADGTTWTGSFTLPGGRRPLVKVERKEGPKAAPTRKPDAPAPKPAPAAGG